MNTVITYFWVTSNFFFFSSKKKKTKLHGAVLNGTVQLLLPCKCREGKKDFWNFSRYSSLLSLHPTCREIPHDPYPHLHNHTLQLPRHHALHLDKVWWTSPPAAYKYRGENRTRGGDDFLRKRGTPGGAKFWRREGFEKRKEENIWKQRREKPNRKKNRERRRTEREEWTNWNRKRKIYLRYRGEKAKTDVGREKQRLRSLHRGEEGPFLTTWAPPLCFLSTATTAPSSCHHQRCQKRNRTEQRGKKKKQRPRALHRGGEEKTAAPPPGIIIISPPSRCPDHLPLPPDHKRGRTEQTRGRGRDSRRQQEEEKKNCNSSIAAWNNARLPPQAAVSSATRALPFQVTLFSTSRLLGWSLACMQSVYCSRFCSKRNN